MRNTRSMQATDIKTPDLSVIIPCYNSVASLEKELPGFIAYVKSHIPDLEVILVDDGSRDTDGMQALAARHSCRLCLLPRNMGKGAALKKGFGMAGGSVQLFTDSDFPFHPEAVLEIQRILGSNGADIVIGDRTHASSSYYLEISKLRMLGSYLISAIGKRYLRADISDTQCGLKGFTASAAAAIFPQTTAHGFAIDVEVLYVASRLGYRIRKLPVKLVTFYPSSVNVVRDGLKIILEILKVVSIHGKAQRR